MARHRDGRSVAAMFTFTPREATIVVLGAVTVTAVCLLPLADQAYFGIVLLGPLLTGLATAAAGAPVRLAVAVWLLCGLCWLALDWILNGEDRLFHLVLTALMAGLVLLGARAGRLVSRAPRAGARPRR
jgi:hypothetical protein